MAVCTSVSCLFPCASVLMGARAPVHLCVRLHALLHGIPCVVAFACPCLDAYMPRSLFLLGKCRPACYFGKGLDMQDAESSPVPDGREWLEYEFHYKPGDVARGCFVPSAQFHSIPTPFHFIQILTRSRSRSCGYPKVSKKLASLGVALPFILPNWTPGRLASPLSDPSILCAWSVYMNQGQWNGNQEDVRRVGGFANGHDQTLPSLTRSHNPPPAYSKRSTESRNYV